MTAPVGRGSVSAIADRVDVAALQRRAVERTGLSDFGDPWFLAPLQKLVDAINAEAGLRSADETPVQRIVQSLVDRLVLLDQLKRKPEILDEKVEVAAAIVGLPRTGSTMLHRLLGSADQLTAGYWWELNFPTPLPGEQPGDSMPRQRLAREVVAKFLREWPDFESIDPIDAMDFCEEIVLLDKSFLSTSYDSMMNVPSYGRWMSGADHLKAYQELRIWLQYIQSQTPQRRGKKWILKTPHHLLGGLDGLLAAFPEARMIMTHRAVDASLPSYCSMCASMTSPYSTTFDPAKQGAYWSARFADGLRKLIDRREHQPAGRFIDVEYEDLIADPLAVGRRVIADLGLTATESDIAGMQACISGNVRDKRPPHRYSAAAFGLSTEGMAKEFAFYNDKVLGHARPS